MIRPVTSLPRHADSLPPRHYGVNRTDLQVSLRRRVVTEVSGLARELRLAREAAGLTREQMCEKAGLSVSLIDKVERGTVPVSETYVAAAAKVLAPYVDVPSLLRRMRDDGLRPNLIGEWLRDWFHIEHQADSVRWWEPSVIPGLLQTEAYARALLRTETEVTARLERQQILHRDDPPEVVVIIYERVLSELVGSPDVVAEQLRQLAQCPAIVQVLPANADTVARLDAAFVMATVGDREYVLLEAAVRGFPLDDREVASGVKRRWEALAREALPMKQSRELIVRGAERWESES